VQALTLVRALLGSPHVQLAVEDGSWRCAVARGQGTIVLHHAAADGQLTL
jgi:hypothetical protein